MYFSKVIGHFLICFVFGFTYLKFHPNLTNFSEVIVIYLGSTFYPNTVGEVKFRYYKSLSKKS